MLSTFSRGEVAPPSSFITSQLLRNPCLFVAHALILCGWIPIWLDPAAAASLNCKWWRSHVGCSLSTASPENRDTLPRTGSALICLQREEEPIFFPRDFSFFSSVSLFCLKIIHRSQFLDYPVSKTVPFQKSHWPFGSYRQQLLKNNRTFWNKKVGIYVDVSDEKKKSLYTGC